MAVSMKDLKAKRTEAVAPRTMFGTVLERKKSAFSTDSGGGLREVDIRPRRAKKAVEQLPLERYQNSEDIEDIQKKQEEYERQIHSLKFAEGSFQDVQKKALFFSPAAHNVGSKYPAESDKWMAPSFDDKLQFSTDVKPKPQDIAHPEMFQDLYYGRSGYFNRDRARLPRDNGRYQLAGDALGVGGLFSYKGRRSRRSAGPGDGEYASPITQRMSPVGKPPYADSVLGLPVNILHQHGVRDVRTLLDRDNVEAALQSGTASPSRQSSRVSASRAGSNRLYRTPNSSYNHLSNALRQDNFIGLPYNKLISLNKDSYTLEPHQKSVADLPPEFGIQRHADSNWSEQNILRERMKREWKVFWNEQPKLKPNWDRNQKPPKPVEVEQPTKPKPKPKLKPPRKTEENAPLEPPKESELAPEDPFPTPQDPPPKDEDFWSFYEQSM